MPILLFRCCFYGWISEFVIFFHNWFFLALCKHKKRAGVLLWIYLGSFSPLVLNVLWGFNRFACMTDFPIFSLLAGFTGATSYWLSVMPCITLCLIYYYYQQLVICSYSYEIHLSMHIYPDYNFFWEAFFGYIEYVSPLLELCFNGINLIQLKCYAVFLNINCENTSRCIYWSP